MQVGTITLTEKYRPDTLANVKGQHEAVAILESFVSAAKDTRTSAAFLFHGPPGVGKTSAAWAMAFDLGCDKEDPAMGGIMEIPSGMQDASAVEETLRLLRIRPMFGSGWKVAIINEADRMTPGAEAMWLDGLERLPSKTLVIFTSNNTDNFSSRFFSRCEQVAFTGEPGKINGEFTKFVKQVWKAETGKSLRQIPEGLGIFDMAGQTLSFRLALQQMAPYARSNSKLPDRFQPPIVRESESRRSDVFKEAARKAVATKKARKAGVV